MSSVIAFDYGERRIGIAVGTLEVGIATPLTTINVTATGIPWDEISAVIQEWQPQKLVLGFVQHQTQHNNLLQKQIKKFSHELIKRFKRPIEWVDEAYTSESAYKMLKEIRSKGERKKINRQDIDKAAAAIILESWFEMQADQSQ